LVKEFYAPSDDIQTAANPAQEQAETQAKLAQLRQELHQTEYYEPLITYETKKPGQGEEATAEKLEREEKEEEQEKMVLEEKKLKKIKISQPCERRQRLRRTGELRGKLVSSIWYLVSSIIG